MTFFLKLTSYMEPRNLDSEANAFVQFGINDVNNSFGLFFSIFERFCCSMTTTEKVLVE